MRVVLGEFPSSEFLNSSAGICEFTRASSLGPFRSASRALENA